ncbi:MAG: DUF1800 family protein [Acidimicrobiales bacterium]
MSTREEIAWLVRRAGWGIGPGRLDELVAIGTDAVVDAMIDPDSAGIAPSRPPFADFVDHGRESRREDSQDALGMWLDHLAGTERPFEDAIAWFWHDHFAVSIQVVQHLPAMIAHLELLRTTGMGSFPDLIRAVTTDAAMLVFLDGATSTGEAPNENYGRELLELYTLGVGNYTEADVQAGARAMTGWVVRRRLGWTVELIARRHDDTPQTFLGVSGVHDVDTVIDATLAHPAVPGHIAGKVARRLLGPTVDSGVIDAAADAFSGADLEVAPMARSVLEAGLDGAGGPLVLEPVPWLLQAEKATGAEPPVRARIGMLRAMGQVPGAPPNVGGFPGVSTWLSSSSTAARFTSAGLIAAETPEDSVALDAASRRDWGELADLLLRPDGFGSATLAALDELSADASRRPGEAHLALALASPDLLIA